MANVNSTNAKQSASSQKEPSLYELLQRYNKMAYKNLYNPNRNNATEKQKQEHNKNMVEANKEKLSVLREILRKVEYANKEFFKKLGVNVSNLKLDATYSFGENFRGKNIVALQYHGQNMETGKQGKNQIFLHMNMEKLLQLPAMEVYAIMTSHVMDSVMSKENLTEKLEPERREELYSYKQLKLEIANQGRSDRATDLFAKYIENFLEKGDDCYCDAVTATAIAIQLRDQMTPAEKEAFLKHNFGVFDAKLIPEKEDLMEYRMAAILNSRNEIEQMSVNTDALRTNIIDVERLANDQQFAQMAAIKLQKDFDNMKGDLSNKSALRGFCTNFVNQFTTAHGMDNIELRFVNDPNSSSYGSYNDKGSEHWIEVNLANITSVTELAATLAHELTHAGDSSLNKKLGNANERGRGLRNNISNDISGSGLATDSPAYKLLSDVNDSCYYINPNERHARIAEYSAFSIMAEMAVNNPVLQSQLKSSIESYKSYINETKKQVSEIHANINTYESKLKNLGLSENSSAYKMIRRRIDYLIALKDNTGLTSENAILNHLNYKGSITDNLKELGENHSRTEDNMRKRDEAVNDNIDLADKDKVEQERIAREKAEEARKIQEERDKLAEMEAGMY